jgi:hypothetical protein
LNSTIKEREKGGTFHAFLDRNEHLEVHKNGMFKQKISIFKKPWWKSWEIMKTNAHHTV